LRDQPGAAAVAAIGGLAINRNRWRKEKEEYGLFQIVKPFCSSYDNFLLKHFFD
jgi:hypothetical protein